MRHDGTCLYSVFFVSIPRLTEMGGLRVEERGGDEEHTRMRFCYKRLVYYIYYIRKREEEEEEGRRRRRRRETLVSVTHRPLSERINTPFELRRVLSFSLL